MMSKEMRKKRLIKQYRKVRGILDITIMAKTLKALCALDTIGFGEFAYVANSQSIDIAVDNMEKYFLKGSK